MLCEAGVNYLEQCSERQCYSEKCSRRNQSSTRLSLHMTYSTQCFPVRHARSCCVPHSHHWGSSTIWAAGLQCPETQVQRSQRSAKVHFHQPHQEKARPSHPWHLPDWSSNEVPKQKLFSPACLHLSLKVFIWSYGSSDLTHTCLCFSGSFWTKSHSVCFRKGQSHPLLCENILHLYAFLWIQCINTNIFTFYIFISSCIRCFGAFPFVLTKTHKENLNVKSKTI